jgi:L-fuconolactonase
MIVDSHAHLIADDSTRYPPASPSATLATGELDTPMPGEQLLAEMEQQGVDRAVLVQRGSIYGYDNSYVCDCAARYPQRFVAVASINAADNNCAEHVRHWVRDRGAVGIRFMEMVKGSGLGWLSGALADAAWGAAQELDISVCVHFFRWNRVAGLQALAGILKRYPRLAVVIDHFSNMDVQSGAPDYGLDALLQQMVAFENVTVKFTTVPLGSLHQAGIDAAPVVARVVQAFGAERVMWGSDITQSKGTYAHMVDLGRRATRLLNDDERAQVLGGAARRVYLNG